MPVDDQMTVRTVLVLANAGLDQRRVFHGRKAESDVIARSIESFLVYRSFAGGRIELWSPRVIGDFESAPICCWNTVDKAVAVIGPDRQLCF